ncbi:hypothetical protein [Bradyrhizobium symbiodeficiens]|uniref:hypothetical protein n=1 Tax=Bradyrhizobium symbiodeficiens TaxID=1404367 RepID=UPI002FE641E3
MLDGAHSLQRLLLLLRSTNVNASGGAAAAREFQVGRFSPTVNVDLNLSLRGQADLMFIAPTYTFATPVLGG